jgi:chromosome segregation ATPase
MPLRDEIAKLLRMPENGAGAPSIDAIESTLTDGYAEALALEAERSRIERRLGEVARDAGDTADVQEFARLSERLETADGELARLRSLLRNLQARRRSARDLRSRPNPS